jgi:hypothetical protein
MDVNSSVLHVRWGVVPRFTSGEAFASKPCLYQAARHCLLPKARGNIYILWRDRMDVPSQCMIVRTIE